MESQLAAVYCYEDGAFETFRVAKRLGLKCIYDLPIAYWRKSRALLEQQAERYPAWEPTLVGTRDSSSKCARKDSELELADAILCPSGFVRDSLPHGTVADKLVSVTPFGSPRLTQVCQQVVNSDADGPRGQQTRLKVLFVGSMTQRKGLADLFEAMKLLDPTRFELHVLGSPIVPMDFYTEQYGVFIHHATRPHDQVLKLMRSMDAFVLPSIVEGRALVQQEALACGLPIVVTANAGAEDLVADETAGFLIPVNDPQAIALRLEQLQQDRDLLAEMSSAAVEKAAELTWESYRTQVVDAVKQCLRAETCVFTTLH
ncbi:glycosyltransferase family 4 protein [Stieleria magnilauensis]